LDRLYVSMVSRYVRNMTKFKNNEQPGTIPAPPRTRPHRRRHPPYPVPSSALSHTLEHPTASHSPPLGIPKQCPSLHPRGHTCQDYTRPRPRRLVPRFRLAASAYQLYTHPPSRHRQCDWHARRKPRKVSGCHSVEHRRHGGALTPCARRVTGAPHNRPSNYGKKESQKVPLVRNGGCVGRNNPKGRRLPPSLNTLVRPTASHSPLLGIPWPLATRTSLASYPAVPIAPLPVPVASCRASDSPQALTGSTLNHRHDTTNVNGTHVESRVK